MEYRKECIVCGKVFYSNKSRHFYCCRKCFRKHYYQKSRENNFPLYRCMFCGKSTELDFDPKKDVIKWEFMVCPHCGKKREE